MGTLKVTEPGDGTRQQRTVVADTAIADFAVTWTANEPTAADSQTIADGAVLGEQVTNADEVGIAIASIIAKQNFILSALRTHGLIASA